MSGTKASLGHGRSTDLYGFRGRIEMAGDAALPGARAVRDGAELRSLAPADVHDFGATRREPAPLSDVDRRRDLAFDELPHALPLRARVGLRVRADEDLRVRMLRSEVDVVGRSDLD